MNTRSRANLNTKRHWLALALVMAVCIVVFPVGASAGASGSTEQQGYGMYRLWLPD